MQQVLASELAYQIAKKSKELKRDIESTLLTNQARAAGNSTTARTFGSIGAWIATNDNLLVMDHLQLVVQLMVLTLEMTELKEH
jgi:hypothetical protein